MPLKAGRFEILGVRATVNTTTSASRVKLIDDPAIGDNAKFGNIYTSSYAGKGVTICDIKGMADIDANLEVLFPEPIKLRHGISLIQADNIVPGSLVVYAR